MEIGLRVPLEGEVVRDGRRRAAGAAARRRRARAAGRRRSRSSCARPSRTSSSSPAPRRSTSARCASRTSRRSRSRRPTGRVAGAGRRRSSRPSLKVARSASRDETRPGAHRHPRVGRRARSCGWSRPTPTGCRVKETRLDAPLDGRFEANVPARALQELTRIVQHGDADAARRLGAREPGRLRGRRRGAVLAADRRPVPQLPPAAARRLRARAAARRRRRSPRSCAASRCWRRRTRRCGWRSPRAS